MIRSLFSAATGMIAQQMNLDVISNNLANVNTPGFKKSKADFQVPEVTEKEKPPPDKVAANKVKWGYAD